MTQELTAIFAELKRITARLDALGPGTQHALKRADAAKAMGISRRKLEQLISMKKLRTAEDTHLVPVSEVRRYCAPKVARQRKPAIGHRARNQRIDQQSDDAISALRERLRTKRAGGSK